MTVERRALCGIVGAAMLLYVVVIFLTNHAPQRGFFCICCGWWYVFPEPFATIAGYLVSAVGFYLLCVAAFGDRLRSRYWFLYLLLAHILSAALVGGLHLHCVLFPPDWIED